jgi:FtsH-binding integral membrane protein
MRSVSMEKTQTQVIVNEFIRSVYNWMAIGLGLTGFIAFYVSNSPNMIKLIYGNQVLFFGLIIGELGLVFYLSARVVLYISYLYQFIHYIDIFYLRCDFCFMQHIRYGYKT